MILPLNEWAVALRPKTLIGNEPWNGFIKLVKTLADTYDVQKILFTKNDVSVFFEEVLTLQSKTEKLRMTTFFNKYIEKYTEPCFSEEYIYKEEATKENMALLLTIAYNRNIPTVSILYDMTFACNTFNAYLYNIQKERKNIVVLKNIHTENLEEYKDFFFTGIPSRELNPQLAPIWNRDRTKKYCDSLPSLKGMSKEEKNSLFIQEATHVARLNGWIEDRYLSKINSTFHNKIRHVFRPVKFKNQDAAYLSIDLEKRAFELLNHRGKHLREISYLGEETSGYKPNHDIILKR